MVFIATHEQFFEVSPLANVSTSDALQILEKVISLGFMPLSQGNETTEWKIPKCLNSDCRITFFFSAIKPEFANLFKELCDEQVLSNIDPEAVKSKKKQRKLDFEVSELRLKIATSLGKNIVLSNREIRLLRHVELTEEDKERLRGSYKVAKKLEKLEGKLRESDDEDSDNNELELPSLESIGMHIVQI